VKTTATEHYECVGDLYYRATHHLRPGKSEAPETGRDSSSPENVARFESWFREHAFSDAIDRIVLLEKLAEQAVKDAEVSALNERASRFAQKPRDE
jgi:hypothetical protein